MNGELNACEYLHTVIADILHTLSDLEQGVSHCWTHCLNTSQVTAQCRLLQRQPVLFDVLKTLRRVTVCRLQV